MVIWEQISLCYSLLSITWPFSKTFVNSFDTAPLANLSAYGSGNATMKSVAAKSKSRINSSARQLSKRSWRNSGVHSISMYNPEGARRGHGSFGSQEMIIRREDEIAVAYDYEHAKGRAED